MTASRLGCGTLRIAVAPLLALLWIHPAASQEAEGRGGLPILPAPGDAPAPERPTGPRELLLQGNASYEQGRYEEAARSYRMALDYGVENEVLHFNLGNALYRLGRLGPAILAYERALLLAPGDPDIRANLEFARAHAHDLAAAPAEGPVAIVRRWLNGPNVNASAIAALIAYLAGAVLLGVALARTRRRPLLWALAAVALVLAIPPALVVATQGLARERDDRAVVLSDRVECRSGPGETNPVLFTVHEGATVRIMDERAGWSRIGLPDGLNGWLPRGAIERVSPGRGP